MRLTKEEVLSLLRNNDFDLVSRYLMEERPQNTDIQTTNLISLALNNNQVKNQLYIHAANFYIIKFEIGVLRDKNNKVITYI